MAPYLRRKERSKEIYLMNPEEDETFIEAEN